MCNAANAGHFRRLVVQFNRYRNEVLAEAMKGFGYAHKLGSGILAVHRTLKSNGNPPAELYLGPSSFGVNLFPRKDEA